jgi:hypothetical protein
MKELIKWKNQKYAVNILRKKIFEIDEVEVIDGDVIVFAGAETNSARNLHTIAEAHYLEEIKSVF